MIAKIARLIPALLFPLLWQCTDDEYKIDPVQFDFGEIHTGSDGTPLHLTTDNGRTYTFTTSPPKLVADTIYRVMISYSVVNEHQVRAYQILPMPLSYAMPSPPAFNVSDPVRPLAVWRGGRYLNARIAIPKSEGGQHSLGFNNVGIITGQHGTRFLQLRLYHDRHKDRDDYYEEHYLTCPLAPYENLLRRGRDSVMVTIRTANGDKDFYTDF